MDLDAEFEPRVLEIIVVGDTAGDGVDERKGEGVSVWLGLGERVGVRVGDKELRVAEILRLLECSDDRVRENVRDTAGELVGLGDRELLGEVVRDGLDERVGLTERVLVCDKDRERPVRVPLGLPLRLLAELENDFEGVHDCVRAGV